MNRAALHFSVWLHRLTAVLGVAWVLALGVLAVRPDWHEAVCHHQADASAHPGEPGHDDEEGCVVTRFAQGQVTAAPDQCLELESLLRWFVAVPADPGEAIVVERALPSARAPPVG